MQNTPEASSNYLPHNFSSKNFKLPMMTDIIIGPEKTVYVDETK
jgi:hypothetical protein